MTKIVPIAIVAFIVSSCGNMRSNADNADVPSQGEVMKINFERSGGFAGMITNVDIDADSLPDAERTTLANLVADANFFALPMRADSGSSGADRFNYRITIESDGQRHTIETTDGAAPASLIPLLDWLNGAARRAQRPGGQ